MTIPLAIVAAILVSAILSLASMGIFYAIRRRRRLSRSSESESGQPQEGAREFTIDEDISNGRELHKVPAISYAQNDPTPLDFHYVGEHVCVEPIHVDGSLGRMSCCQCLDDCATNDCECVKLNRAGPHYDQEGRLTAKYLSESVGAIRECNVACKCNRRLCKNMVIQGGCKLNLVLFKTRSRGWGVRAAELVPKGAFIGNYSGELISVASSTKRPDDTYLFNLSNNIPPRGRDKAQTSEVAEEQNHEEAEVETLQGGGEAPAEQLANVPETVDQKADHHKGGNEQERETAVVEEDKCYEQEPRRDQPVQVEQAATGKGAQEDCEETQSFICDAKYFGNFTRFINHSCEPNVIGIRTFTVHQDDRFPYISFFANQDIQAGEELTLNYGDNYWLVKCRRDNIYCLCKAPNCKFTKKTFKKTLKRYNEKVRAANRSDGS